MLACRLLDYWFSAQRVTAAWCQVKFMERPKNNAGAALRSTMRTSMHATVEKVGTTEGNALQHQ